MNKLAVEVHVVSDDLLFWIYVKVFKFAVFLVFFLGLSMVGYTMR